LLIFTTALDVAVVAELWSDQWLGIREPSTKSRQACSHWRCKSYCVDQCTYRAWRHLRNV